MSTQLRVHAVWLLVLLLGAYPRASLAPPEPKDPDEEEIRRLAAGMYESDAAYQDAVERFEEELQRLAAGMYESGTAWQEAVERFELAPRRAAAVLRRLPPHDWPIRQVRTRVLIERLDNLDDHIRWETQYADLLAGQVWPRVGPTIDPGSPEMRELVGERQAWFWAEKVLAGLSPPEALLAAGYLTEIGGEAALETLTAVALRPNIHPHLLTIAVRYLTTQGRADIAADAFAVNMERDMEQGTTVVGERSVQSIQIALRALSDPQQRAAESALLEKLRDPDATETQRIGALHALEVVGGPQTVTVLTDLRRRGVSEALRPHVDRVLAAAARQDDEAPPETRPRR